MRARDSLPDARLLLVTDPHPDLTSRDRAAVRGGVDMVQLRDKHAPREDLIPLPAELREICESEGAIFTVNDDVRLARITGAAGIHLGQEDTGTLDEAMEALREEARTIWGSGPSTPRPPSQKRMWEE